MFTIDLLKGQGIPRKSGPEGIALVVVTFAVPACVAIVLFSCYLRNAVTISIQKQGIASYQTKTDKLSDAVKTYESLKGQQSLYTNCLSEVKSSIVGRAQWSPVLATVVENLPDPVVLTKLEVIEQHIKRKVPQKDDPKKTVDISVPVRTLKISVAGNPQYNSDAAVRDFRDRLLQSRFLEDKLQGINVSQASGTLEDREVVCYEIDCIFKPPF